LKGDAAITVADTGHGIAPEHLAKIFRPFYPTKGKKILKYRTATKICFDVEK